MGQFQAGGKHDKETEEEEKENTDYTDYRIAQIRKEAETAIQSNHAGAGADPKSYACAGVRSCGQDIATGGVLSEIRSEPPGMRRLSRLLLFLFRSLLLLLFFVSSLICAIPKSV
jgi:hypothetical protein